MISNPHPPDNPDDRGSSEASQRRVEIIYTRTAIDALNTIPKKQRRSLIDKFEEYCDAGTPEQGAKRLRKELHGLFSLRHSRFRLLYAVTDDELANGDIFTRVQVQVLYAGERREGHRKDVYTLTKKLIAQGIINLDDISQNPLGAN